MHFNVLPLSIALSLVSSLPAHAQSCSNSSSSNFLQEYLTFLNSSGYTSLSNALQQVKDSNGSHDWLDCLSSGNWTAFVPNNQAFSSLSSNVSNNTDVLSSYLSYHHVHGDAAGSNSTSASTPTTSAGGGGSGSATSTATQVSATASAYLLLRSFLDPHYLVTNASALNSSTGIFPNDTIGRTLLTDDQFVKLEGDRAQVLAWSRPTNGSVYILNQATNVTVGNTTQFKNILLAEVSSVLIPPGNLSTALTAVNDTALLNLLNTTQVPINGSNTSALNALQSRKGFTLFAPNNDAFTSDVNRTLQFLQNNQTALLTLLQNHYVNGTTVYSPTLLSLAEASSNSSSSSGPSANTTLLSAAGEPFAFASNQTGLFVSNGNGSSARIVRPDVLIENGVVHVIDKFLINESTNSSAAASAAASASSIATQTASDTAILGLVTTMAQSSSASASASSASASATGGSSAFRFHRAL